MKQTIMNKKLLEKLGKKRLLAAMIACIPLLPHTGVAQTFFKSPDVAANTLVIAAARSDDTVLEEVLGENYRDLLPIDQISAEEKDRFFQAWAGFHAVIPTDANTRMLAVGENGWTMPIPIVREAGGWRFDTVAGSELMRVRRIGRNELSTMQALLAYRDAQLEYAVQDHDGDGVLEYAQRFISSAGGRDGLYWEATPDEPQSPLGPLFVEKTPEDAYYGYRYRILTSQGANAPGGAADYLDNGNLVSGFAAVAWPAEYGKSGVMSFMLSRDGALYEADLGSEGGDLAMAMPGFDPDALWMPVLREFTAL